MTGGAGGSDATRAAYDAVAPAYEALLRDDLATATYDRAVLGAFAELVSAGGSVLDVGCGPGRITGHLAGLGLDVAGVDLSPAMVAVALERLPGLSFGVGSLEALDVPDGSVAAVCAWYSLIHTPPERLPAAVAELARVLTPGGQLVTAFQAAPDGERARHRRIERAYGVELDDGMDAWSLSPDWVADLLAGAGLVVHARLQREPEGREWSPQAYLSARKPGQDELGAASGTSGPHPGVAPS